MTTGYIGKIIDKHIFLICEDSNGNKIQCPHVELFTKNGFVALSCSQEQQPKAPYKFLTKLEVAQFFNGLDTDGNKVKTPTEFFAEN